MTEIIIGRINLVILRKKCADFTLDRYGVDTNYL